MSKSLPLPDWAPDTDPPKAKEIQRLAEMQLEDLVSIAVSGDSRAATLAAAMSAISAALLAGAVTILGFTQRDIVAVYALLLSSASFIIAAGLAVASAAPSQFYLRGYHPRKLMPQAGTELDIVRWSVEDAARKLDDNRCLMKRAGWFMYASYAASAAGIILPLAAVVIHLQWPHLGS